MLQLLTHQLDALPAIARRDAKWTAALDAALVPTPRAEAAFARLQEPGALVVTTGQQPGLFTGPLYSVHKALAAVAIARRLEAQWRCPVIPIFWIAGDDHDFVEASSASWSDAGGNVADWQLPPRPASAPQLPMSSELLMPAITDGLSQLEATLPAGAARSETLAWLRRYYRPGATIHEAYSGAIAELLAPYGVLCFDPTTSAVKSAQRPLILQALERATELDRALAALPDPGTGIAAGDGATLVFVMTAAGRDRIVVDGEGYRARRSGDHWSRSEMLQLVEREPDRFSANVLLRPVVESALLPTVAYIAGPGEYRYLTRQASVLYPLLGVHQQQAVPRWSGTVITRSTERLLSRLRTTAEIVMADDGTLGRELLDRDFPGDARQALSALRQQLKRSGSVITAAGKRADPVLERAMQGRLQRLALVTDDIEAIFLRHLRKRDQIAYAQYVRVRHALLPHGKLQERVFTAATYLSRYGSAWTDAILEATLAWAEGLPDGTG